MTDKHHSHIEFHKKFQQVIQLALTDNKETIDGIDHLFKQEPDTWKPALIIAYRHLAEDRMRVNQCAETNQASAFPGSVT